MQNFSQEAMATKWTLRIDGVPANEAAQAADEAFRQILKLENLLSRFIASSDISAINELKRGERIWIQKETWDCLEFAQKIASSTQRAFDATAGTLIDFWKQQNSNPPACTNGFCEEMPAWREAFENFRFGTLAMHEETQEVECIEPGFKIDLGGIAKGFTLDYIAGTLTDWGIEKALLSAGGSTILALDAPTGKDGWKIGFSQDEHPPILLKNAAIASSGTQFSPCHIVNPKTGLLAIKKENTRVLCPTATEADALSTAFFCMTDPEIKSFLENPENSKIQKL